MPSINLYLKNNREARWFLLIFLLAVSVRVLFFYVAYERSDQRPHSVVPHLDGYYEIAENLLRGNGFSKEIRPPFIPDSVRTPLYPLFIAGLVLAFKSYYVVLAAQIVLGSLIPLLGYRLAVQILAQDGLAKIVALALALEPLAIDLSVTLISETFFTVLFLSGITLFLDYINDQRGRVLAYATGLLALATLARPTIQYLPFLLMFGVFFLSQGKLRKAILHSFVIIAVFTVLLVPWRIRNLIQFQNPALSVQYASVPYGYLIPSAIALEKNIGFEQAKQQFYAGEGGISSVEDITLANAGEYQKRIMPILLRHPVGALKSIGVTILTFFTHDGYLDVLRRLELAPHIQLERPAFTMLAYSPEKVMAFIAPMLVTPAIFVILGRILWILISLFFLYGIICHVRRASDSRSKAIFSLIVISYFVITTVAVGLSVNARFRMPVNALILPFAVYGILRLLPKRSITPPSAIH